MKNKSINFISISMLVLASMLPWDNVHAENNRNIISGVELFCDGDVAELEIDTLGYAGIIGFAVERFLYESGEYVFVTEQPFQTVNPFSPDKKVVVLNDKIVVGEICFYRIMARDNRGRDIACGVYDVVAKGHQVLARSESSPYQSVLRADTTGDWLRRADATDVSGSGTVINICVTNDGLFTVSASNIAACLSDLSLPDVIDAIAETNMALACRGDSVSWLSGENNESLLFYGSTTSSLYQVGNIYQLRVGAGVAIAQESVAMAIVTNGQSFIENLYFEKDIPGYFTKGESRPPPLDDFWIWDFWWDSGGSKTFELELPNVDATNQSGVITTELKGYYKEDTVLSNNHVRVSCNGVLFSDLYFTGWDKVLIELLVTNLVSGNNTIAIEQVKDTGTISIVFLESIAVSYSRKFHAQDNALIFDGEAYSNITVSGFTTNEIALFDITDEKHPLQLSGSVVNMDTNGLFSISFIPQASSNIYLTAVPLEVHEIHGVKEDDLLSVTNEAEYILLTTHDFLAIVAPVVDLRKSQGLKAMLLDLEQVYDVFSDGVVTPYAIKDFLAYTYTNWSIAPRYVLLAGAGTWDFLDKEQNDPWDPCLIPPLMYYMNNGDSTEWIGVDTPFGDVVGDAVPEIMVGRLPVANTNELAIVVDKILAYEKQTGMKWKENVTLLADNPDPAGDFHADSDVLADIISSNRPTKKIYLTNSTDVGWVRAGIVNSLNAGSGYLSYLGHGNSGRVADEDLINDVSAFTNIMTPAIMFAFTCELGRFALPVSSEQGLLERMIISDSGGLAAGWAPASLSYEDAGVNIASNLFESIFQQSELRVGDAIKYAFERFSALPIYDFLYKTFEFQGDPAMIIASDVYTFDGWREQQFSVTDLTNAIISDWDADPDADGINNLEEYNGGTNPTNYNERIAFYGGIDSVNSGSDTNHLIFVSFPKIKWSIDVNTYVDICYDLMITNWFDATKSFWQVDQEELNAQADRVTLQLLNTNLVERKMFLRTRTELE